LSERPHIEPVEDFTVPFLVSFFVLVFIALFAIWALWGIVAACATGWLADRCITFGARSKLGRR
jgi:hypothetical protein